MVINPDMLPRPAMTCRSPATVGSAQQADAQRETGQVEYQQSLIRNQQAQAESKRPEDTANAEQAGVQRRALEEKRKARIMASRVKAVMAASGTGIDNNILNGILAEGDYAADVALYEGDTRADSARYDATLRRWEGGTGLAQGGYTRAAKYAQAGNTLTSGIIGAGLDVGSMAAKYGGPAPGGRDDSGPNGGVPLIY